MDVDRTRGNLMFGARYSLYEIFMMGWCGESQTPDSSPLRGKHNQFASAIKVLVRNNGMALTKTRGSKFG